MAHSDLKTLEYCREIIKSFVEDVTHVAAYYEKPCRYSFINKGQQEFRSCDKRRAVYDLHDIIGRTLDDLPLVPPSGSGQIGVATARTALNMDFFDDIQSKRSRKQLDLVIDAYGLFELMRMPTNKTLRARQIKDIKRNLRLVTKISRRAVSFAPKLKTMLYRESFSLATAFDAAPAVARVRFLQEFFAAAPVIDAQQPAASRYKKVRELSFATGGSRQNDRILLDAANPLYVKDCVFNAARLAQLADDLPVGLHADLESYDYTGATITRAEARLISGKTVNAGSADIEGIVLGPRVIKMYVSILSVTHQIAATALDAKDANGKTVSGGDAVKRSFAKLMGVPVSTLSGGAASLETGAVSAVRVGTDKWTRAMSHVETLVDGSGKVHRIGGRFLTMLGLYGAMRDFDKKKNVETTTKLICTMMKEGASLRAELIAFRVADNAMLDDAAKAAASHGMRRLAMIASVPLMVLDAYAAVKGIDDATRVNDMSVAFGHFLAGSASIVSGCIGVYMFYAGIAVATGPLGVVLAVAMAVSIAGALLIWLTQDPKLETALEACFFGTTPSTSDKMNDANHRFGGTKTTRKRSPHWTYSTAEVAEQTFAIRSLMYGTGIRITAQEPDGSNAAPRRRWVYQGVKTVEDKFKAYQAWTYSVHLVRDGSDKAPLVPNWVNGGTAKDLWAKGQLEVRFLTSGEKVADVETALGLGKFKIPDIPVLSDAYAPRTLELRVFGPKPEAGGDRQLMFRERAVF